MQMTQSIMYR